MNPVALQTLQIMLSMITSDKETITEGMKKDAKKVISDLMIVLTKDANEYMAASSSIQL